MIRHQVVLPYPPSANTYWRTDKRGKVHVSSEATLYKQLVHELLGPTLLRIDGTFTIRGEVFRPINAGDLTNRIKVLEDVLREQLYEDDRHTVGIHLTRHQADDDLGWVELEIRESGPLAPTMQLLQHLDPEKRRRLDAARLRLKAAGSERKNAEKRKAAAKKVAGSGSMLSRAKGQAVYTATPALFRPVNRGGSK